MWRTPYDTHVFSISGSSYVTKGVVRADGTIKYFRSDGSEYPHFAGTPVESLVINGSGSWTYTTGTEQVETYDAQGRLTSIWDRSGLQQTLAYDANNRLQSVTDARGRVLSFVYIVAEDASQTVQMTTPAGQLYTYAIDSLGNLRTVGYPGGATRTYLYENATLFNAITGIEDENGAHYEAVDYDTSGRAIDSYLAPDSAGGTIDKNSFVYTSATSTKLTDPLGKLRVLTFSTINGVSAFSTVDALCPACGGNARSKQYDSAGYPASTTDFDGNVTTFTYDDTRGLETSRTEASNTTGTNSPKRTIATQWHPTFRVPAQRTTSNANGVVEAETLWAYNTRGQVLSRCDVDPSVSSATSYSCGSLASAPAGVRQSTYAYCEQADITANTCPLIGLTKSTNGPRAATDTGMSGLNDTTTYTYYQTDDGSCLLTGGTCAHRHGDLWKVTNALGQVTTYVTYDKNGRVTRMQDANGTYTDVLYHPRGWLTDRIVRASATGAAGAGDATTHIDYDAVGNVIKVTQPDGAFLAYTYDDAHRLIKITDNLSNAIDYCPGGVGSAACLDAAGNRLVEQVKDPSGTLKRSLHRSYNQLSQLIQVTNAASAPVEHSNGLSDTGVADGYDGNGNRVLVQDGLGITTKQRYDGLNRLVATIQNYNGADFATANTTTQYTYDTRDNLRQVTDPDGDNTVYTYDGLNNLTHLTSPDTGGTTYVPDKAGNRISQTDNRGTTSTYTYDALNRLTAIGYPTTSLNVAYAYDQTNATTGCTTSYPIGRLTQMTDGSGSTTYCYDRRGNVTQKKQVTGTVTLTTQYGYTVADRLASITYPSNAIATYTRDVVGRVKTVTWKANATASATTIVSNASYYPFGPLNVLTWGNGRTLTKTYDQDYAIDTIASSATTGLKLDLGVDVMGDITHASGSIAPTTPDRSYAYDPLYRLTTAQTGATPPVPLEGYTYGKTGDRASASLNGGTTQAYAYTPGTHKLASVAGAARTYDPNGNTQTGIGSATLTYDDKNRLSTAIVGTTNAAYKTNGRGERVSKAITVGGLGSAGATVYTYDESGQLLGDYSSATTPQAEYVYLDGTPIAVVKGGTLSYIETDHLGTPRQVVNPATNTALWTWDLLASTFGVNAPNQSPAGGAAFTLNLRFPGQYYDVETGLNYNYFRDYEPATGRYIESDPIGLESGTSTYSYVDSAPGKFFDVAGLKKWDPGYWNQQSGQVSSWANCYGYARNATESKNPGGFILFPRPTCEKLIDGALADGMVMPVTDGDCGGNCPKGFYKVQIFLDDTNLMDRDYHVYRQDDDSGWSHKLGTSGSPQRIDSDGGVLSCPIRQPKIYPPRNYKKYCGTLCNKN